MRQGKRTTTGRIRAASGLALAVAAALGAAGCTSSQSAAATTSTPSAHSVAYRPQLILADARAAYAAYVTTSDNAASSGDESVALSVLTGAAADTLSAQYQIAHSSHLSPPYTSYRYGTPTYYLPQPSAAGDPEYFLVSVPRSPVPSATPQVPPAQDMAADVQLPASGAILMLFEKAAPSGAWQVASISQLTPGESVPGLATQDGYVIMDRTDSVGTQLVRPALVPPLQAGVVDDGPASPAAQVVAGGPLTTGLHEIGATSAGGIAPPPGDAYQWLLEGSNYGRLSLRTANGGTLVLYTMYFNRTVQTKSSLHQDTPVLSGPPITVPANVAPLLSANQLAPKTRLQTQDILTFAAIDPPAADKSAKIQVIAIGGGLYSAQSS